MVIKSSLEAINDGYIDANEEKDYLAQLLKESTSLERLVNDLLELSRLQSTEFQLQKEPVNPLDCINDAVRSYRIALKEKNQEIILVNRLTEPKMIDGDYMRITQVIKILLDNANIYSPEHSIIKIVISNKTSAIDISLSNKLTEPINDTTHLSDSFHRQQQNYATGTGLGLAIARQVILRHQGQIAAEADQNQFMIKIQLPSL